MGLLILLAAAIMAVPVLLIALIVYGIRHAREDEDDDSMYIAAAIPFLDEW